MTAEFQPDDGSLVKLGTSNDFEIGGMRVMPARRQIRLGDDTRTLQPRVMQVLVTLAEARPRVVSRDQLAQACWGGLAVGDDAINRCIVSLRKTLREFEPEPFTIETIARVGYALRESGQATGSAETASVPLRARNRPALFAVGVAALLGMLALIAWQPWQRTSVMTVAVAPATQSPGADELAHDLTAKLGMLTSVSEGPVRLLDRADAGEADLLFRVDFSTAQDQVETNLVLLNRKHELLWSKDVRRPAANIADFRQQIAFTAGTVLQCSLDALSDRANRLDPGALKLYLNACAAYAENDEENYRDIRAMYARVTEESPRFRPAWRRLIVADSEIVRDFNFQASQEAPDRAQLQRDLAAARRVYPDLPEILLGRAVLLPVPDFLQRLQLIDRAIAEAPEDLDLLEFRSRFLMQVGRLNDALEDSKKVARLNPLSSSKREDLITTLAAAGKTADAKEELRKAERLWPGAANLLSARYLLHLRFAEPQEAIRVRNSGRLRVSGAATQGSFLEARANPTPENVERALADARVYFANQSVAIVQLAQALVEFGREDELFAILLNGRQPYDEDDLLEVMFRPAFHNFHRDRRFMQVAQRLGLRRYWQSSGKWPDFCFEPDLPYDCKREAAKLT